MRFLCYIIFGLILLTSCNKYKAHKLVNQNLKKIDEYNYKIDSLQSKIDSLQKRDEVLYDSIMKSPIDSTKYFKRK